jgi:beta-fructofuranosidase
VYLSHRAQRVGARHPQNPIVIGEPDDLNVTGFRDPSIFEWPALGEKVGSRRLAVVSGGVQGDIIGPRMFLFGVDPSNLTSWSFLKTLGTMKRNVRLDPKWSGDFGTNWECGNFISLKHNASGLERMIGFVGVEGGHLRDHVKSYRKLNPGRPERDVRYCNWFFANLTDNNDNDIDIEFDTTGMMDSGEWYAPSVFLHPDGRRIAWGWIVEQDISKELAAEKGWIGCLGVPRELSLGVYEGVIGTCRTSLAEITSVEVVDNQVLTLDIRPLRELENLRRASLYNSTKVEDGILVKEAPECYELLLRAGVTGHGSISLKIRESESVQTTISFNTRQEELIIHRDASTLNDGICLQDEIAALTLFRYPSHFEPLELRVFVDKDVVEVFANGRVAIATRIYGPKDARRISIAHEGDLRVSEIQAWTLGGIGLVD